MSCYAWPARSNSGGCQQPALCALSGINLAYLYNVRASISEGLDVVTDFVLAQRTRRRVIQLCQGLLDQRRTTTSGKRFEIDQTLNEIAFEFSTRLWEFAFSGPDNHQHQLT